MTEPASTPAGLGPDHGYGPDIDHVLLTEEQIQAKIGELAEQVAADYAGTEVLLVGVLKGAVLFMSDFARALQLPTQMEFMAVSSYGSATSSSGVVRILKDLDRDITDKHVLVVEDIIDSGLTLSWLLKNLGGRSPASLEVCALLRKPDAVKVEVPVKYIGFDIPNEFVVGYGLDYAERYRDLPYIATLKPEVYRRRPPDDTAASSVPSCDERLVGLRGTHRAPLATRPAPMESPQLVTGGSTGSPVYRRSRRRRPRRRGSCPGAGGVPGRSGGSTGRPVTPAPGIGDGT